VFFTSHHGSLHQQNTNANGTMASTYLIHLLLFSLFKAAFVNSYFIASNERVIRGKEVDGSGSGLM
jgi:hypothetical protein